MLKALMLKYEAEIEAAKTNIDVYINNPAGIGEHSNIVEAIEEELMRELQGRAEDDTFYNQTAAQQSENQARRYIMGAQKQLEGLAKMIDRLESQGEL